MLKMPLVALVMIVFFFNLSGSWQKSERHGSPRFLAWRLDSTQLNTCVCVQVAPAFSSKWLEIISPIMARRSLTFVACSGAPMIIYIENISQIKIIK